MQGQCIDLRKDKPKRRSDWCMGFLCCAGNMKNTGSSDVWRNDRGQCRFCQRTTFDDIWYLTDVGHGSDMWYTFRQKTIFELGSGYLRGKNFDELKHCPRKYNTGLTDSSVELFW